VTWASASVLWWLLAIPVLAALPVVAFVLRRRAAARFGREENVHTLVSGHALPFRAARGVLLLLGLTLAVVALARPQYGSRTRVLRKRGIDVVVALDFSKSMLARDVRPSRIARAKAEVERLLAQLDGDRVGVVAFAGETQEFPMTIDPAAVGLFLHDLGPYDMPVGGTAIGRALVAAKDLLDRSAPPSRPDAPEAQAAASRSRVVILMTDGEDHEGDPIEAAHQLADAHIQAFVVGIGSSTGEPIPTYAPDGTWTGYMRDEHDQPILTSLTSDNERQLREIATITGGRYFRAARGTVGMDQILLAMRRLKQDEQRSRRITVHEDRYALLLLPAFLFIVLESLLPEAWAAARMRRKAPKVTPR